VLGFGAFLQELQRIPMNPRHTGLVVLRIAKRNCFSSKSTSRHVSFNSSPARHAVDRARIVAPVLLARHCAFPPLRKELTAVPKTAPFVYQAKARETAKFCILLFLKS
jgi:hypothetical protein